MAGLRGKYLQKLVEGAADVRGLTAFGNHYFVDGWDGLDGHDGSEDSPFLTMAKAFTVVASGDTIHLRGRVQEQITAPQDIFDVTIIGTSNRPRHGTADGVQQGYPAQWNPLVAATATPNLTLREQGWIVENILFDAPDAAACIAMTRAETAGNMDASHATIRGCKFIGGETGIEFDGGSNNCLIEKNVFQSLTQAIHSESTAIDVHINNMIRGNVFSQNTNDILAAIKWSVVAENVFGTISTLYVDTTHGGTAGSLNLIHSNYIGDSAANWKTKTTPGTGDVWTNNHCSDAIAYGS
jgi:hypothetical protein